MSKTRIHAHVHLAVDTVPKLLEAMLALEHREVLVGIPEQKTDRKPEKGQKRQPITNAEIAYIQNYGSPARNIDARPFMEPGIKDAQPQIENALQGSAQAALDGNRAGVEDGFDKAGLVAVSGVRNRIRTGDFKSLSSKTVAARKRRGRTGTKPLQDTGQMRNAITYVKQDRK